MSEYQYYEFQAIDRSLREADRQALRAISSRARITATSFTNTYEWGDLKGDPTEFMKRWFDLHVYVANWASRRLMLRLPKRLVDRDRLQAFIGEIDWIQVTDTGESLIVDINPDEVDVGDEWDDGSGWLASLAPLRADILGGDLRLFYLLWLAEVAMDTFAADVPEPLPGIGPLTPALEAFVAFIALDRDLVEAVAERAAGAGPPSDVARKAIAALGDGEKTGLLVRLADGDPHVAAELRALVRDRIAGGADARPAAARTVGELQSRAEAIRLAREHAQAEKAAAERSRQAREAEKARRARLDALAQRGEKAWIEIDAEIERRNPAGYDRAAGLLLDLRGLAEERGKTEDFARRLRTIRERHAQKKRFIERLVSLG